MEKEEKKTRAASEVPPLSSEEKEIPIKAPEPKQQNQSIEEQCIQAKSLKNSGNLQDAVELYSHILDQSVSLHGETSIECAPIYFEYGKCLLELAQSCMDALGGIMKKNVKKKLAGVLGVEEDISSEDEVEENILDANELLETAWEVLELARVIYGNSNEHQINLSNVHLVIGDLCMESENMSQAVQEYLQCLKIRQAIFSSDDRRLAETHYSLGLALEYLAQMEDFSANMSKAVEQYTLAHKILTAKLSGCNDKEAEEIKSIIQELQEKIEELSKVEKTGFNWIGASSKIQSHHVGTTTIVGNDLNSSNQSQIESTPIATLPVKRKAPTLVTGDQ